MTKRLNYRSSVFRTMADQRFFITSLLAQQEREKVQQEKTKVSSAPCNADKKIRPPVDMAPLETTSNALSVATTTMPSRAHMPPPFWSMATQEQSALCASGAGQGSSGVLLNPFSFCTGQPYPVMPASMLSPYDQLALTSKSFFYAF